MSWIAIIAVALLGIGLATIVVAIIENHHRLAPIVARWEFAFSALLGVAMAAAARNHWLRGETYTAAISTVLAGMLLFAAVSTFRKGQRAKAAAADSAHDRSGR